MTQRWKWIGIVAGVLFALNLVGRGVSKIFFDGDDSTETTVGFVALAAVALVVAVLAFHWGRDRPVGAVAARLAGASLVACLLSFLVGPFVTGGRPFANGGGDFFAQIWWYAGFVIIGAFIGTAVLIVLGQDLRSKQLKSYVARAKRV
jgi:hypothetical protein